MCDRQTNSLFEKLRYFCARKKLLTGGEHAVSMGGARSTQGCDETPSPSCDRAPGQRYIAAQIFVFRPLKI